MLSDERLTEIDEWLTDFACTTPEIFPDWLKTIIELRAEVDRLRLLCKKLNEVRQNVSKASIQRSRDRVRIEKLEARLAAAEAVCEAWVSRGPRPGDQRFASSLVAWRKICEQQDRRESPCEPIIGVQSTISPETPTDRG